MSPRQRLIDRILRGHDPFVGFPKALFKEDKQGWGSSHYYLEKFVTELKPSVVVEIGVWKGMSSIFMASQLRDQKIDGVVVSIDTWLGASEHWLNPEWYESLNFVNGQPMIMKTFMTNIASECLENYIIPMQLDSVNAAEVFKAHSITIDLLHIDAAHDYTSVKADLSAWWPLLRPGGVLIGDDYYKETHWQGVREAFDEFFSVEAPGGLEHDSGKCFVRKEG